MNKWQVLQGVAFLFIIGMILQIITAGGSNVPNELTSDLVGLAVLVALFVWASSKTKDSKSKTEDKQADDE